jgi:hypothetical protein
MANMMRTAEKALHKRATKTLAGATKRYKKFMRQAAKAASETKREQYVAAALGALVVTGVVAQQLMSKMEARAAKAVGVRKPARKKKKAKL